MYEGIVHHILGNQIQNYMLRIMYHCDVGFLQCLLGLPQHWKIGSMNDSLREDIALIISIDVERAADKM